MTAAMNYVNRTKGRKGSEALAIIEQGSPGSEGYSVLFDRSPLPTKPTS